jgi:hypothetical protein
MVPSAIFSHEAGAMSAYECIADVKTGWTECLLMTQSGHLSDQLIHHGCDDCRESYRTNLDEATQLP